VHACYTFAHTLHQIRPPAFRLTTGMWCHLHPRRHALIRCDCEVHAMQRVSEQSLVLSSARRWARPWPQRAPLAAFYIPNLALATSGHNVVGKTIDETFVVVHAPLLSGYAAHADTQHTQHKHGCAVAPCSHGVIRWVCCRLEPWPGDRKAKLSPVRPVAFCVLGGVVLCSERGLFGDEDNSSIRDIRRGYSFF
jgi:hypothetical protein